jgi:hypothetical protein
VANGYDAHSDHHMSQRTKRTATGDWRQAPFRETTAPSAVTQQEIHEAFADAFPKSDIITEALPPWLQKGGDKGSSGSDGKGGGKSVSAGGKTYDISTEAKAKSALSSVQKEGKFTDIAKVRSAVYKAYPDLRKGGSSSSGGSKSSSSSSGSSSKKSS